MWKSLKICSSGNFYQAVYIWAKFQFHLHRKNRFQIVDIQNATLSGGVAVGAIADLMLQPGGAFMMGTITGLVSAFGYRLLQVMLATRCYLKM